MSTEFFTPDERRDLLLSVGTHKGARRLSPIEVAKLFRTAISRGASMTDCAQAAQLEGTTIVGRFLRLLDLPPSIQHLIDWGKTEGASLGFTAATELARLKNKADEEALATAALQHRLGGTEVRQVVQLRARSGKPIAECIAGGLKMRPEIEIRHVFVGAVLSDGVRAKLDRMLQAARNEAFNNLLERRFGDLKATGRLASDKFTLVGREALGARVRDGVKLEAEINRALETL